MQRHFKKKRGMSFKTACGLLVVAPKVLRGDEVDFLLIGDDGIEYQLLSNNKTYLMWSLIDTNVQLSGIVVDEEVNTCKIKTITYKCIDDFGDDSQALTDENFDIARLDFAI